MISSIINAIFFPSTYLYEKFKENSDRNKVINKLGNETLKGLYKNPTNIEGNRFACMISARTSTPEEVAFFVNKLNEEDAKTFLNNLTNEKLFEFYFHPLFQESWDLIEDCFIKRYTNNSESQFGEHAYFLVDLFNSKLSATQIFTIFETVHSCSNDFPYLFSKFNKVNSLFLNLFFENPEYLLTLLSNPKYNFKEIELASQELEKQRSLIIMKITPENDKTYAKIFAFLMENKVITLDFAKDILYHTLRLDLPETSFAIAKFINDDKFEILEEILEFDSIESFKKLCFLWKDEDLEKKLTEFIDYNAPKCLTFFLTNYRSSDSVENTQDISDRGLSELLLTFSKGKASAAALSLFYKIYVNYISIISKSTEKKNPDFEKIISEITKQIQKIFRFSSLERVDELFTAFVNLIHSEEDRKALTELYQKTKTDYLSIAPFISHHVKSSQLKSMKNCYLKLNNDSNAIDSDLKYGTECRSKVEELLIDLKENRIKLPKFASDCNDYFQIDNLPPSSKGTRRAAALLEKISEFRSKKQTERSGNEFTTRFLSLRKSSNWHTPITGRYHWAYPLTLSIYNYSQAKDMQREKDCYYLKYKNLPLNKTIPGEKQWYHGLCSISATWPDIEDLFEELMAFKLAKPAGNSPEEVKRYQDRLTEFYSKAAELVWLIGNTQPLERGSGTFAEWMFAIVHLANGLEPPVLKKDFPQLDVLDITFPLSDYKKFFPYFFEPSTVPEHMRRPSSSKSLFAQIEDLYKEANQNISKK